MDSRFLRACLGCVSLCLPCLASAATSVDICREPAAESHLSIAYYDEEESSLESGRGETNREFFASDLLFRPGDKWTFGIGHRSTILNVDRLELQTNGYLHTFFFPMHRLSQSDGRGFRFSVAPALSGSSNVTSDPDEYAADAVQVLAALVWNRQISEPLGLHYGICGDHRLGEYRVYPVIGVDWQVHPDWAIELGFPTSQLVHQVSKSLTALLRITPNGNEWFVKDKSLENHSRLVYEGYTLELELSWRAHEHFLLTAGVGREFRSRYEMTLLDLNRVRLAGDRASRVGMALAWIF